MNRETKRALKRQMGADAQEKMSQQISSFSKLPEKCDTCSEPFDKTDREMLASWNVVVRQDVVRLFCPNCIKKTQEVMENGSR